MPGDLVSIGSVVVDYRLPALKWTSAVGKHGIRTTDIAGAVELAKAQTLSEICSPVAGEKTIGGFTGVLQYLVFSGDVLTPFTGYYLILSFVLDIQRQFMFGGSTGPTAFSLTAAFIGDLP